MVPMFASKWLLKIEIVGCLNKMNSFYKFTAGTTSPLSDLVYVEGLNCDPRQWSADIGLHFTTLPHAATLFEKRPQFTHVWDVTIPEGETRIAFDRNGCRAASLIMRNMRPIAEIFRGVTEEQQIAAFREHDLGFVPTTRELRYKINRATKISEQDGVTVWSNGLRVQDMGSTLRCTMDRDIRFHGSDGAFRVGDVSRMA